MSSESVGLGSLLNDREIKWIFVGGKGGVGKTSSASSLAYLLSTVRSSVLLVSTDPAHNISDAFDQKIGRQPTKINGVDNLYAMEVDAESMKQESLAEQSPSNESNLARGATELLGSLPGIDEAFAYFNMLKLLESYSFDVVIFDTAPTGHTLRLLSLPSLMETALKKLISLKSTLLPIFSSLSTVIGENSNAAATAADKLNEFMPTVERINQEFRDARKTTFIVVAIPEFLSLYETERLIQSLAKLSIDVRYIIINQVLSKTKQNNCQTCTARSRLQERYIGQFEDLYDEDFTLIKVPLLLDEVRGVGRLKSFAKLLVNPGEDVI